MKLTEPTLTDALYIAHHLREEHRRELQALRSEKLDFDALAVEAMGFAGRGLSWTAWHESRPVALFGVTEVRRGVYASFILATDDFPAVILPLTRFAVKVYRHLARSGRAHRIETTSYGGNADAHRWIRLMGGREEARLTGYGVNGEDFLMFKVEAG